VTIRDIPKVLRVYDAVRRPFALEVCRRSHLNGSYYTGNNPDFKYRLAESLPGTPEHAALLHELGQAVQTNWQWAWTTSFDDNMEQGLVMLKKLMKEGEVEGGLAAML
jgi:salicylate hydroxylase